MMGSTSVRHLCVFAMAILCAKPVTGQNAPPAEAFRVLPAAEAEGPQITPYLLYQTALAWDEDEQRRERWSRVKNESDLLRLRTELRQSLLEMIGGLPAEKTDLLAEITGRVPGAGSREWIGAVPGGTTRQASDPDRYTGLRTARHGPGRRTGAFPVFAS